MSQNHEPHESVERPHSHRDTQSISNHAQRRLAQRNLDQQALDYVLKHGRVIRRTGILFYVLAARDIPREDRRCSAISRLIGTTLLVAHDGTVITVYRNRRGLHAIVRKHKRWVDMRQHRSQSPTINSRWDQG